MLTSSVVSPSSTQTVLSSSSVILAKGDSAASDHYFHLCDTSCLNNIQPTTSNPIILPDKTTIHATHTGELPLHPSFSKNGKTAKILPQLTSASLISIGKLCDNNCQVTFDKSKMCLYKNNQEIMRGIRNPTDGLWDIPLPSRKFSSPPSTHHTPPSYTTNKKFNVINIVASHPSLAVIIRKDTTKSDLAQYLHAACFSPVLNTWEKAIKNNHFSTWPGLTAHLVCKHLPISPSTVQGHLKQEQQGLQSTTTGQRNTTATKFTISNNTFPISPSPNQRTHDVAYAIIDPSTMTNAYFDLTGKFPQRSSSGNQYIFVGYNYDANSILAEPIKNRTSNNILSAWQSIHAIYERAAVTPHIYIFDNEFSQDLQHALHAKHCAYQLVPPNMHHNNLAKRAIQTWKSHFKAGLASCDPDFPLSKWD